MKRIIAIIAKVSSNRKEIAEKTKSLLKGKARLNDVRIASNHIELDLMCENVDDCKEEISKEFKIIEIRLIEASTEDFSFAKKLFNSERFWEVHEVLEGIWRKKRDEEKRILHGLILLAASFVHYQRGRIDTCMSILERAYKELEPFDLDYEGFNIKEIKKEILDILKSKNIRTFKIT